MTWDFRQNLAEASDDGARRMAETCLRHFFARAPDFSVDWAPGDTPFQQDLDVIAFGERYKIEHKHRPRKDYGDELLEDVSNDQTGRQGWTWRASSVDYVLYTYPTSGRWTIWPGPALESAWRKYRAEWIERYGLRHAPNRGYQTVNVPVPTSVLKECLTACGGPVCSVCLRNVGRFSSKCATCGELCCCAVSDGEWVCARCSEPRP